MWRGLFFMRSPVMGTVGILAASLLLLPAPRARGQNPADSSGAPLFQETDPYAKLERKQPSMWHDPSEETPSAQLALATKYEREKRISRAIGANRDLVHEWHDSPEAAKAQHNLARLLEERGDYEDAFIEYQYLIAFFSGQFPFLDALDRQFRCANALCDANPTFLGFSTRSTKDIRRMYEHLLANGPRWAKAPEVALRIAALRESEDEIPEAIAAYERVQNRYPNTDAAHDAAYRVAWMRCQFALKHPRDAKSRADAIAAMNNFLLKYRGDAQARTLAESIKELEQQTIEAAYAQAVFYDRQRNDRVAAMAAYHDFQRRYPDAPQAREAAARLQVLERRTAPALRQGATNESVRP